MVILCSECKQQQSDLASLIKAERGNEIWAGQYKDTLYITIFLISIVDL